MKRFLYRFSRAVLRVIPRCITQTQAIAFNMFVALFPMLLLILGITVGSKSLKQEFRGIFGQFRPLFPAESFGMLTDFVSQQRAHTWDLVVLGFGGTFLAGTQMMKLMMDGFEMVQNNPAGEGAFVRNLRAFAVLSVTMMPFMFLAPLVVFGRQVRMWLSHGSLMPIPTRLFWTMGYVGASLLFAVMVISLIYRLSRPDPQPWSRLVPGAALASILWWIVSIALGYYFRHAPYSIVYGALAAAIGLMLWMQLTATILLIGAAYNAELQQNPN